MSTDRDWEKWGAHNPYFGVLSDPKFAGSDLSSDAVAREFFESGVKDINWVMEHVRELDGTTRFKHAIDFGCGVGRLSIPLASFAEKVTGFDVSPSFLNEAKRKTPEHLLGRISYVLSTDLLDNLSREYDFVHSYIVLQHIPPKRGEKIIAKLLNGLSGGGIAALHVTLSHTSSLFKKTIIALRNYFLPFHYLLNMLRGRLLRTPRMRMYLYNMNRIKEIFRNAGISETLHIATDHGGYHGVMIIGKKIK